MNFDEAGLPDYLLTALGALNVTKMTDVQEKVLPLLRAGKDVAFCSATGSGKTFCYAVPAVEGIRPEDPAVQVLALCPTRELCMQITGEFRKLCVKKEGCRAVSLYGGTGMQQQIYDLKKGARIVVGTPGRVLDHLARRVLKLGGVRYLIIDEADEMLSMGFEKDLREIVSKVNPSRRTVLCSATMPERVRAIVKDFMTDPVYVESEEDRPAVEFYYSAVGVKQKFAALTEVLGAEKPHTSIVFCNTKRMADGLKEKLAAAGIDALALHGDLPQPKRKEVFDEMRSRGGILVATDVAARGIDLSAVDLIVSYDLPDNAELFTHRAGRTARAGKSGKSFTIVNTTLQRERLVGFFAETGNRGTYYVLSTVDNYGGPETYDTAPRSAVRNVAGAEEAKNGKGQSSLRPERTENGERYAKSGSSGSRRFDREKAGIDFRGGGKKEGSIRKDDGFRKNKFADNGKSVRRDGFQNSGKPNRRDGFRHGGKGTFAYDKNDRSDDDKFRRPKKGGYGEPSRTRTDGAKTGFRAYGESNSARRAYGERKSESYAGGGKNANGGRKFNDKKSGFRPRGAKNTGGKYASASKKPAYRGASTPGRKPFKKG